jgi:hypothetical protein
MMRVSLKRRWANHRESVGLPYVVWLVWRDVRLMPILEALLCGNITNSGLGTEIRTKRR